MSIILEKPATSEARTMSLVVSVEVTRNALAYALGDTDDGGWGPLEEWSVEFIREFVGVTLAGRGVLDLERWAHLLWRDADRDPAERAYVESVYRAIDRAYPELAPAVAS